MLRVWQRCHAAANAPPPSPPPTLFASFQPKYSIQFIRKLIQGSSHLLPTPQHPPASQASQSIPQRQLHHNSKHSRKHRHTKRERKKERKKERERERGGREEGGSTAGKGRGRRCLKQTHNTPDKSDNQPPFCYTKTHNKMAAKRLLHTHTPTHPPSHPATHTGAHQEWKHQEGERGGLIELFDKAD